MSFTRFVYCTVLAVLVEGITDSATQFSLSLFASDSTVGITPLSSSNFRTVDSRTLELSTLELLYSLTGLTIPWIFFDSLFRRNSCLKVGASEPNSDHQS
jgi:hypothetical protein